MALITSSPSRHTKTILSTLDGVGALLSILCAIHCLILPFLVGLIPFLQFLNQKNHDVHFILAGLVLPIGAWAFLRGYRYHHRPLLTSIGCSGLVILSLGTFIEPYYFSQGVTLTILGSFILITSHWYNWRWSRCIIPTKQYRGSQYTSKPAYPNPGIYPTNK